MSGDNSVKYFSIKLSKKEVRRIKVFCAKRSITLKEWYCRAFESFNSARLELEGDDARRLYRARPAKATQVSGGTDAEAVEQIRKWAVEDNVRFSSAYYTAIIKYLENCEGV